MTEPTPSAPTALEQTNQPSTHRRPRLIVFDVNETLSDMSGLANRFADLGVPPALAGTWFASLLRDGFALTVTGANPGFADVAATSLAAALTTHRVQDVDAAVQQIMDAFTSLPVHGDTVDGITALAAANLRLVTLTNGSATVAQGLLERNGIAEHFERLLSVQDTTGWKPAPAAYAYALEVCDVAADDAMLVAVHPWDIHGAQHAGLMTAYLNRTGAPYPGYFHRPDIQVASLVELAEQLTDARDQV